MPQTNGILIVAETAEGALAPISAELLGAGRRLADQAGCSLGALLLGNGVEPLVAELASLGAEVVYLADEPALANYEGSNYARVAEQAAYQAQPAILLLGQTLN